jgi:hypothetical protein
MSSPDLPDHALDALLRAGAPAPVPDDGFVARTMAAVDHAARGLPAPRRPAPVAPILLARALVAERQRQARRSRQWHWAIAGAVGGYALMLVAMALSPSGAMADVATPAHWTPLALLMACGAVWIAWRELRAG